MGRLRLLRCQLLYRTYCTRYVPPPTPTTITLSHHWVGLEWNGLLVIVSVLIDGVAAVDVAAAIDVDVCGASFIVT